MPVCKECKKDSTLTYVKLLHLKEGDSESLEFSDESLRVQTRDSKSGWVTGSRETTKDEIVKQYNDVCSPCFMKLYEKIMSNKKPTG